MKTLRIYVGRLFPQRPIVDAAVDKFHEDHGREHNYSQPGAPVEVYRLQVKATRTGFDADCVRVVSHAVNVLAGV
jgi:hypothetical protein